MKLIIHRGAKQIGGSCVELVTERTRLIIDAGLPLDDLHDPAKPRVKLRPGQPIPDGLAPKVPGLFAPGPKVDAILLSHAHADHSGLLAHTQPNIPIHLTQGTSKMLLAGSIFAGQVRLDRERCRTLPRPAKNYPVDAIGEARIIAATHRGKTVADPTTISPPRSPATARVPLPTARVRAGVGRLGRARLSSARRQTFRTPNRRAGTDAPYLDQFPVGASTALAQACRQPVEAVRQPVGATRGRVGASRTAAGANPVTVEANGLTAGTNRTPVGASHSPAGANLPFAGASKSLAGPDKPSAGVCQREVEAQQTSV